MRKMRKNDKREKRERKYKKKVISNINFNGINPSVIQNTSLFVLNQIQDFTNNDIQKMNEILAKQYESKSS